MVKAVMQTSTGTITTLFVSAMYQVRDGSVTKYYQGGAFRVGGVLYYGLSDHLGSSTVTVNPDGSTAETRYTAWGEVRYQSGSMQTDRTYTGQRTYTDDFGLMFYNARWYDNQTGRFAQADNIDVKVGDTQSLERFAYVGNNPVNRTDPSGHIMRCKDKWNDAEQRYTQECYEDGTPPPIIPGSTPTPPTTSTETPQGMPAQVPATGTHQPSERPQQYTVYIPAHLIDNRYYITFNPHLTPRLLRWNDRAVTERRTASRSLD